MSTVTKLRKRADGSLEHYLETTETPASLNAKATALLENAKPPEPERTVTGMFLTPKAPDGSGGKIVKRVRVGPKEAQQFAAPVPYFARSEAAPEAPESSGPTTPDALAKLKAKQRELQAIIDDNASSDQARLDAQSALIKVLEEIQAFEAALHPVPRAGKAPTAGQARQFAEPTPHFQLSDAQRAEHEAQATALRAKLAAPGLSPGQRIRLEQELKHLEQLLQMDAAPTPDHSPLIERRAQG